MYIALRGLAEMGKFPSVVGFAAGRPAYLQNDTVEPTGQISESTVLSRKLTKKLSHVPGLEKFANPHWEQEGALYLCAKVPVAGTDRSVTLAQSPYCTNSEDDIRAIMHLSSVLVPEGSVAILSAGIHTPRCDAFRNILQRERAAWRHLNARVISADYILGTFRPAYKKMFRALEGVNAYKNTAVDELAGTRRLLDGDYKTSQPSSLFPSIQDERTSHG
jgi:hypothetical protein